MPQGSCICGKIRIEYDGEPKKLVVCHCADCRKISGASYGTDLMIPVSQIKVVAGEPRLYNKTSDAGNVLTSRFCGDCGTTLYRSCDANPGVFGNAVVVKLGVMDCADTLRGMKPEAELFVGKRLDWVEPIQGVEQRAGMVK